jgi:hypothetical protein
VVDALLLGDKRSHLVGADCPLEDDRIRTTWVACGPVYEDADRHRDRTGDRTLPLDASSSHGDRAAALLRDEKFGEASG